MTALCVEEEAPALRQIMAMCGGLPRITEVRGTASAAQAIQWLAGHHADVALLDADRRENGGLAMVMEIRQACPGLPIILLSGSPQYALEAIRMRVSGYLLKPVEQERLAEEVAYALSQAHARAKEETPRVRVRTFGGFDVYAEGKKVAFKRSKAKELLAYLIDRQGCSVKRAAAFGALWEDTLYDRGMQKQMDVIVRSLRGTLREYGIAHILHMQSGEMRIVPEEVDCDLYSFLRGDPQAVRAYRGEYMNEYSWANFTEGRLEGKKDRS